jgi:nicotinate dehydrogenase subunit A
VESAANQTVETVEHLVASQVGAVVRQSFIDVQAAQCGYCINGILVSLIVMFQQSSQPEQDHVLAVLDRHLCRCGAHSRILKAVDLARQRLAVLDLDVRVDV